MKVFRNIVSAALVILAMAAGSIAPASADIVVQPDTGCTVITNPSEVSYNANFNYNGTLFPMAFTGTLHTGGSSSACNDINMSNLTGTECDTDKAEYVLVQYLSGGVWHNDSVGMNIVDCNKSSLVVIATNYANGAAFRVLVDVGSIGAGGPQGSPFPHFKLYV